MSKIRAVSSKDDDKEVPYLDRPEISKELADKVRGRRFESETDLLDYFLKDKPEGLKWGRGFCLDSVQLEERMNGLCLKLNVHGYKDRADRLHYLYSTLKSKYVNKDDSFRDVVQFLMEMSIRPTAVTNLEISEAEYSPDPDEDISIDEDSEKQRELLKQILSEHARDEEVELQYSSDSDLSEWTTDEEEDFTEKSTNDIPPIGKIRQSSSFGEFSDLPPQIDPEIAKQETRLHWLQEQSKAEIFFQNEVRRFNVLALTSQPVISSRLVLQSRFGEFWEWKTSSNQKPDLVVAFEEDIVREILWQFVVSDPMHSPVFTCDWQVKPNLMVATLSKSSFNAFVSKFSSALQKLQCLREFSNFVEKASTGKINCDEKTLPSKVYRSYAAGLQNVSVYITEKINEIERELKKSKRVVKEEDKIKPGCCTLLQLKERTRRIMIIVNLLYEVHSICAPPSVSSDVHSEDVEPWFESIKLTSCLETFLLRETDPSRYGVLLFLFSKCLHALLDDILSNLRTLRWNERYSLFVRNIDVRLNDSNFWSDCIKVRQYKEELISSGISPLICLDKLLPEVLNILKTCEVLDQIEEDFSKILSNSVSLAGDIIAEFLEESLSFTNSTSFETDEDSKPEVNTELLNHFTYIGLGDSYARDAFRFLLYPKKSLPTQNVTKKLYNFEKYVNLTETPFQEHSLTLEKVLAKQFTPFCLFAKENIQKIFQDYKVVESLQVFQEVILAARDDFARRVMEIASTTNTKGRSETCKYEDSMNRNPKYQQLLAECYPEGREIFSVDLKLDSTNHMNCTFIVTPYFPLNLIVTPQSVAGYLFIGRQLHRIRKSLWDISSLSMKDCRPSEGVHVTKMLLFRFCLINFCSAIRSFFTLKLFSKDFRDFVKSGNYDEDLDSLRRIHEDYLELIETRMLKNPLIENIILKQVGIMSQLLKKRWSKGIPQQAMVQLEDTLKRCWQVVNDFKNPKHSLDFKELSYHFGPPPTCLNR